MITTQIYLRRGKEESLLRRHPWIFSGAIERIKCNGDEIKEGEVVDVFTKSGVDAISVRTDQDYVKSLMNLFAKRN